MNATIIEQMLVAVQQLDDTDADVLMALIAQAVGQHDGDTTWISASRILDYRGLVPKERGKGDRRERAGHRQEDIAAVEASIERLAATWVALHMEMRVARPGRKKTRVERQSWESPLIVIQQRYRRAVDSVVYRLVFEYQLGRCLREFLAAPNLQTTLLPRVILTYDPYRQQWEKRLGRHLSIHLRIAASSRRPLRRTLGDMLKELGLESNRSDPKRTRARFEQAMQRLVTDGVIAGWRYASTSTLPARGWLAAWLARVIEVPLLPPETVAQPALPESGGDA